MVINITTKRHNFPKCAVKRRQMPFFKASQGLWLLLGIGGWTLPEQGLPSQHGELSQQAPAFLAPAFLAPAHAPNTQHVLGCPRQTAEPSSPASWSLGE